MDLGAGVAFLFLYQSVGRRMQEVVNRMLHHVSQDAMLYRVSRDIPECNAHAPDGLALEAVGPGSASHSSQTSLVEVVHHGSGECIGRLGIHLRRRFPNDHAVKEAEGLAHRHGDDNEGDQEKRVDAEHDQQTEVGLRVVEDGADENVESRDAGL
jgi:hypothetical protein